MCGIAGFLNLDGRPAETGLAESMASALIHRGPDGGGVHVDGAVALAHRRLAILDPVSGVQPMCNEDGTIWVTYNGEIYNSPVLREGLLSRGHVLKTHCDTEVLVHLWEEKGPDLVADLTGMFAFALWDSSRKQLFLVRDRLGIKPLYYARYAKKLAFASELKALCQDPEFPRVMNSRAVSRYFCFGYILDPETIFQHAFKLPPAHVLLVDENGAVRTPRRYWSLSFQNGAPDRALPEAAEEGRALLDKVVREHMLSDVPVGAFLSGGIDSSLVVASMRRTSSAHIKAFSIGFDEPDFDESLYAQAVARHLGVEWKQAIPRPELIEVLPRIAHHFDEPFGDSSCLPTLAVSQLASRNVKVVLSGDGGDETFGGYPRYTATLDRTRGQNRIPAWLSKWLFQPLNCRYPHGMRGKRWLNYLGSPLDGEYLERHIFQIHPRDVAALLRPLGTDLETDAEDYRSPLARPGWPMLDRMQDLDIRTYLPGDILTKVDRASMAASLEVRVPFLDHRLMEWAARLSPSLRASPEQAKILTSHLAQQQLPALAVNRPKMGFAAPMAHWFKGPCDGFVRDCLTGSGNAASGMLDRGMVESFLRTNAQGAANVSRSLWMMLVFEFWCRTWLRQSG